MNKTIEVYDLRIDPGELGELGELINLFEQDPAAAQKYEQTACRFFASIRAKDFGTEEGERE